MTDATRWGRRPREGGIDYCRPGRVLRGCNAPHTEGRTREHGATIKAAGSFVFFSGSIALIRGQPHCYPETQAMEGSSREGSDSAIRAPPLASLAPAVAARGGCSTPVAMGSSGAVPSSSGHRGIPLPPAIVHLEKDPESLSAGPPQFKEVFWCALPVAPPRQVLALRRSRRAAGAPPHRRRGPLVGGNRIRNRRLPPPASRSCTRSAASSAGAARSSRLSSSGLYSSLSSWRAPWASTSPSASRSEP